MSESRAADILRRLISVEGPISLAVFMRESLAEYYAKADPLGAGGDFVTAPEISQMFGECVGAALVNAWEEAGRPPSFDLVELGPGRGTLMADMLRTAEKLRPEFAAAAQIRLVETSPALIERQRSALEKHAGKISWHAGFAGVPESGPLLLVANEFFDALPVRQFVRTPRGFCERCVTLSGDEFIFLLSPEPAPVSVIPESLRHAPVDSIVELRPEADALADEIARRISRRGALALVADYGHADRAPGDTLQAVKAHAYADPLASPGEADLTAHVDFTALASIARNAGASVFGPVPQGKFLTNLGIAERAAALSRLHPGRKQEFTSALQRLTAPAAMGELFKVIAIAPKDAPTPAGFQ